jgi:hypothetical protein
MKSRVLVFALACASLSAVASASEVIVTGGLSKSASSFSVDVSSSGDVASFNFRLFVPGADVSRIDLSKCVADLPKNWRGSCAVAKDAVYLIANSEDGKALPSGLHSVGTIRLPGGLAKAQVEAGLIVDELFVGDAEGRDLRASVNSSVQ